MRFSCSEIVLSDQKLRITKLHFTKPECRLFTSPTAKSLSVTNSLQNLSKLSCETCSFLIYQVVQLNLERFKHILPSINIHDQIKRLTDQGGRVLQNKTESACQHKLYLLMLLCEEAHTPLNPMLRSCNSIWSLFKT